MAISIDTVYQRVLALANKEQRGYITPQEFNLLAGQAQMEIFEQYFYDQNQQDRNLKNSTEFSNVDEMLDEKIAVHKATGSISAVGTIGTLPSGLYRLGTVYKTNSRVEIEQLTEEEALYLDLSPISKPSNKFPAFVRMSDTQIRLHPALTSVACHYIRVPPIPYWGYVVVNEKALYNAGTSIDFAIHKADSSELVYKILSLAGIVINKAGLQQFGASQIANQTTQEKQ